MDSYNEKNKEVIELSNTDIVSFNPSQYGSDCDFELKIHIHRPKGL